MTQPLCFIEHEIESENGCEMFGKKEEYGGENT